MRSSLTNDIYKCKWGNFQPTSAIQQSKTRWKTRTNFRLTERICMIRNIRNKVEYVWFLPKPSFQTRDVSPSFKYLTAFFLCVTYINMFTIWSICWLCGAERGDIKINQRIPQMGGIHVEKGFDPQIAKHSKNINMLLTTASSIVHHRKIFNTVLYVERGKTDVHQLIHPEPLLGVNDNNNNVLWFFFYQSRFLDYSADNIMCLYGFVVSLYIFIFLWMN